MKVQLDLDKANWHPSPLPGQIVLVATVDAEGRPNIAPKSWVTMAAFGGPVLGFGCSTEHATLRNAETTGEFVVNVVSEPLAETVWALIGRHGEERLQRSGLTLAPASTVAPPLVVECPAHFECRLERVVRFESEEVFLFGTVVAASIDEEVLSGPQAERYFRLRPVFFLEDGVYGSIDTAKRIGRTPATAQPLFLVRIAARTDTDHEAFLQTLATAGRLLLAGTAQDEGALYVLRAASSAEAEAIARSDPLAAGGAPVEVRSWTRTF